MAAEATVRLAARMKQRRAELGLTQREVADRIGLKATDDDVSRWERAAHRPGDSYLELIAKALETDVADLVTGPKDDATATSGLLAAVDGDGDRDDAIGRLERIEGKLDDVLELLATDRDAAGETDTGSSVEGSRETSGR